MYSAVFPFLMAFYQTSEIIRLSSSCCTAPLSFMPLQNSVCKLTKPSHIWSLAQFSLGKRSDNFVIISAQNSILLNSQEKPSGGDGNKFAKTQIKLYLQHILVAVEENS